MPEMSQRSFSLDEVRNIKEYVTHRASYASRISLGFAFRLADLAEKFGEDRHVLHEIDILEGLATNSSTKEAEQFKWPPLHPLLHKHFSTPRHFARNVGEQWGLGKGGNRHLPAMIEGEAVTYGDQPGVWPKRLAYQFWFGGLEQRVVKKKMTGDWIIFAKHDEQNFYLDLAAHEEATQDAHRHRLLGKLRSGSAWDFPFLFQ